MILILILNYSNRRENTINLVIISQSQYFHRQFYRGHTGTQRKYLEAKIEMIQIWSEIKSGISKNGMVTKTINCNTSGKRLISSDIIIISHNLTQLFTLGIYLVFGTTSLLITWQILTILENRRGYDLVWGWVSVVMFDCISNLDRARVLIMRANQKIDDYNQLLTSKPERGNKYFVYLN